ncbi:MAG: OmpP1/FadL family transporter [Thermoguttaceae bacterium]
MRISIFRVVITASFFISACFAAHFAAAQGVMLRGAGAVNESVAGVGTAMPLDSTGALIWNPATISALKKNEISFSLGLIIPETQVSSSVGPISGSTKGQSGAVPVPNMSFVWRRCPKSPVTYGFGLGGVGGAASLYAADAPGQTNPILGGLAKSANVVVLQLTPTVSYQVNNKLSVGIAPLVDLASLNINPMQLGQPLGTELHNYGTRYAWGGGFQIGAYYDFKNNFKTGFMFKSPIWAEKLHYEGTKAHGAGSGTPVSGDFDLDLPMTLSWGVSYDGIRHTTVGLDVRYFDYANTAGFKSGVNPGTGIVEGLDWDSVMAISIGGERRINEKLKVRMGYCWNQQPIPSRSAALAVAAPMIGQHVLGMGASYAFARDLELSVAYSHSFLAKVSGYFPTGNPLAPIGNVTNQMSANVFVAGITKKW